MIKIRNITEKDCETVHGMIKELAAFEKMEDQVTGTPADLHNVIFNEKIAHCFICEVDGEAAGYLLYYFNVSTFKCRKGVYIEDIYVRPQFRDMGIGLGMIQNLAYLAMEWGCSRMEWMCLDWNTAAQDFYKSLGAEKMGDWELFRIDEKGFLSVCSCSCHGGK